ncbi:RNA polymerase subunit sigma-70 [Rhodopirellula sp. MGV]|nr:RNA polymerase subunit sigma-70 [Rhodopirellula sp. MGV]PNY35671.1 RNA polymerase subunit sigma-70 [Rhodopirellula baltica]
MLDRQDSNTTGTVEARTPAVAEGSKVAKKQKASKKIRAREPSWVRCSELEAANSEIEDFLTSYDSMEPAELKVAIKRRLREELAFISNPEFSDPQLGKQVFDQSLELAPRKAELGIAAVRRSGIDMPIHLGRLCEAPLLNPEQERLLFQRMNYLLQQAEVHRSQLNPQRPSRVRMELIDRLIALAEWHRDRIVEANLRLVFSIVKKFVNPNNNFDDLLSDGIVALIRAVEKFDFDRGFRFSTYATQVIRRNSYRTVVVKQQERQKTVGGLQDLDLDITDEGRESAISEKRWHELRSRLSVMLDDLDRREKLIIRARFSLGSHRKVHTLQSLANRLGVSKERVRQLERRAMEKLRAMAGKANLAELEPQ